MPDTFLLVEMLVMLMAAGAFAGVLAGLLGVGGGIILVPSFFFVFQTLGYDSPQLMQICLATSLATIIVTSVRSLLSHNKRGAVEWSILRGWAPGIVAGALLGVLVATSLRSVTLQAVFGTLALIVGIYMASAQAHWRLGNEMPKGLRRMLMSPALGFLSVLMGIGGGSFGVPVMTLYGVPIHRAVATAAGFGVIIAVPSVIAFLLVQVDPATRPPYTVGAVNFAAFGVVVAMTLMTAPLGVKLAHAMDPKPLKRAFAVFLTLVALNMLRKTFGW
ncbi:sulfite exporter TauE/SafE family protein [Seohaeicola saemankumensis]|uniref:Probable membrane transporter protein n=1 Tax=Seohaeicola saemankumensis TaxID=481181 RepID=A0ABW3TCC0_9RHOB